MLDAAQGAGGDCSDRDGTLFDEPGFGLLFALVPGARVPDQAGGDGAGVDAGEADPVPVHPRSTSAR